MGSVLKNADATDGSRVRGKLTHMVHVVGAIIVRDGLILAAQRGVGRQLAGMWEFPGGKVETGEAPATALAREIREELNMDVRVDSHFDTTIHSYPFARVTLDTYFAEIASGTPVASEHAELRWCTANDLEELIWAPADIPAVHKLLVMLRAGELPPPQR